MDQAIIVSFVLSVMTASTPLLLAATGELVTEKSGVLNLGVEGMMLVGAIVGFATTVHTGSALLGVLFAVLAGMAMALIFAILTLTFLANQVATGLALTIFGTGLSALVGSSYVGTAVEALPKLHLPALSDIPLIGPILLLFMTPRLALGPALLASGRTGVFLSLRESIKLTKGHWFFVALSLFSLLIITLLILWLGVLLVAATTLFSAKLGFFLWLLFVMFLAAMQMFFLVKLKESMD